MRVFAHRTDIMRVPAQEASVANAPEIASLSAGGGRKLLGL
jgi:hypothetical protein